MPLVGASGAISGVQGMYFILFPHNRVKLFIWLFYYVNLTLVNARWIMVLWFALNDILPLMVGDSGPVAHAAHLGGFGVGLAGMLGLKPVLDRMKPAEEDWIHAARYQRRRPPRIDRGHSRRYRGGPY